jgi:hypothetical protein
MPATHVIFYAEQDESPFLAWLDEQQEKVQDKIFDAIARLEQLGYELRRPEAEYLRDDIYELRVKKGHVNYRPLYFFDDAKDRAGRVTLRRAVIAHGCTKEGRVEARDIDLAAKRRKQYLANRAAHTYEPPGADED